MALININSLKSFYGNNSFLVTDNPPAGHDELVKQAESIVYQHTLIPIPEDIANAIPTLQNYAHSIYIWFAAGFQNNLDEKEIGRRRDMYKDAMYELNLINKGQKDVYDKEGNKIATGFSSSPTFYVNTEDRTERL